MIKSGTFKATWCTVTDFTATYFTETAANMPNPLSLGAGPTNAPTTAPTPGGSSPAGQYGNNQGCEIAVSVDSPQIEVVDFNVEAGFDMLFINGARNDAPTGQLLHQ